MTLCQFIVEYEYFLVMPSTRKQEAKEKRSRQSDVMSDLENMDVLGNYAEENYEIQEENVENEIDLRSTRQDQELDHSDEEFKSYVNTNLSENNGLTVETNRAINFSSGFRTTKRTQV